MDYTAITIIYNPNSTGPSKSLAQEFRAKLQDELPRQKITLLATQRAEHAEELAYACAQASKKPLIISSSGDGGYNEVINGALRAQDEGAHPTVCLLPAGNANDHFHNLYDEDQLVEHIAQGPSTKIDVLKISGLSSGMPFERRAHSYIGFGLTPVVGRELNKTNLNFWAELRIVLRSLFTLRPVRLRIDGRLHKYDSVIFSNIDIMAKYLQVSSPSSVTDGKFEVTIFEHRSKARLLLTLLRASVRGVEEDTQTSEFTLQTVRKTLVQVDGEVFALDAGSDVRITMERRCLASVL